MRISTRPSSRRFISVGQNKEDIGELTCNLGLSAEPILVHVKRAG